MCGIAGIIRLNNEEVRFADLKLMSDTIAHRGPDGEGHWISNDAKVGFAHRRLSILDLSVNGKQPMHFKDRFTITFNGEIYNYIELKHDLIGKGYSFHSDSDTEVLMAMYDQYQNECLTKIDGMFALVIYDRQEKKLFCARDRFGEKPFYYHYVPGQEFLFASEMKAIHALKGKSGINQQMLYNYLAFNYVDNRTDFSETFFEGISSLPHAHYLMIDLYTGIVTKKAYWSIDLNKKQSIINIEESSEKLKKLFYTGLQRRLRSDVTVGSSLSGGVDSSIIVCAINEIFNNQRNTNDGYQPEDGKQKTFSARFPGFLRDEGKYMQMVTDVTNVIPYFTYPNEETLLSQIDKVAYYQEEPFGSSSILAQYEVMRLAKENNVTVLLDGQGADEVFAGYHGYYGSFFRELGARSRKEYLSEYEAYEKVHSENTVNPKHTKHLGHFARKYFPSYVDKLRFGRTLLKQRTEKYFNADFFHEYSRQYYRFNNSFSDLNQELNYASMNGDLQVLLRYADRNSMAHSREVRIPFLYHELVEYAFSLPSTCKIHLGWTKWILRKSFADLLPTEICWRKEKVGYEPPQKKWMENGLIKEKITSATEKLVLDRILDKRVLNKTLSSHATGEKGNNEWAHLMTSYL